MLYQIGLPSNTATPLALFVGIEHVSFSCIWQQTHMATNTAIAAQIHARCFKCPRGQGSIYLVKLDSAVLTSVQEQLENKNRTIRR